MKIAYGILCHMDPPHIGRLARKLTVGTENLVFVHVDAKADFPAFQRELSGLERVTILPERLDIHWGGYHAVEATIALMRAAIQAGGCGRFQLLQGLDYPILSNKEIDAFFEENADVEFLKARNVTQIHNIYEEHKYRLPWMLDKTDRPLYWCLSKFNSVLLMLHIIPHFKKNYVFDDQGNRMELYSGCAQWGCSIAAAEKIVRFYDQNPKFNRYFQSVYAPDECYYHTILYNSDFAKRTTCGGPTPGTRLGDYMNITYYEYEDICTVFTKCEEWPRIRDSGKVYFRKVCSQSTELLDMVDEIHRKRDTELMDLH